MEEEWSCYRGGHSWGKNGHATDVASLRMGENGHVTEVTLVEIEGSCYRCSLFNGGIMVVMAMASLKKGEWFTSGQFRE